MNKWIKLPDLPEGFWSEVFLAWKSEGKVAVYNYLSVVKKVNGEVTWHSDYLKMWLEFRSDVEYLIMPIVYPTVTEEDFK